jgi:hypothetical protein
MISVAKLSKEPNNIGMDRPFQKACFRAELIIVSMKERQREGERERGGGGGRGIFEFVFTRIYLFCPKKRKQSSFTYHSIALNTAFGSLNLNSKRLCSIDNLENRSEAALSKTFERLAYKLFKEGEEKDNKYSVCRTSSLLFGTYSGYQAINSKYLTFLDINLQVIVNGTC